MNDEEFERSLLEKGPAHNQGIGVNGYLKAGVSGEAQFLRPHGTTSVHFVRPDTELNLPVKKPSKNTVHEFSATLDEVLEAIVNDKEIGGIRVAEAVQNPAFRFKTQDDEKLSVYLSAMLSATIKRIKSKAGKVGATVTNEKRGVSADEYATSMFKTVQELKAKENIKTYRATVQMLTEKAIPTPNGGKWHLRTLQDLEKRWQKLGLIPEKQRQPK